MNIGERLKLLRKELGLTQVELAERICIRQTHMSSMEKGIRNITDRTISDICRETGANEHWLRTGEGEMLSSPPVACISELAKEYNLDQMDQNLISEYLKLDRQSRTVLKNYIKNVFLATSESEEHPSETIDNSKDTHSYLTQAKIDAIYAELPKTAEEFEKLYPPVDIGNDVG